MKKVNLVAAIAMTLFSATAFAEQGSGQLNQVIQPTSSADYSHSELTLVPADLTAVNGNAAMNSVMPVAGTQTSARLTPADLTSTNGDNAKNAVMQVATPASESLAHDFNTAELNEFNS